jgi:hypothetical protein
MQNNRRRFQQWDRRRPFFSGLNIFHR